MKLFLIGLSGCGKSTLGLQLARHFSVSFVDLDTEIEKVEKTSIATLFREKGEVFFREREREQLDKFCGSNWDFVMATGGGTPCFFCNIEKINQTGTSLFLDVPSEEICRRLLLIKTRAHPFLVNGNSEITLEDITSIRNNRIAFYQQAHIVLKGKQIDEKIVLKKMKGW